MKKIFSIALAVAFAFSAVSAVSAQSMSNAFNTNLTIGSRGADVVALQSYLESKGLLTMPSGVAKGYFGGLTKSAVVAFQISKNVTPASGYFGPLTRAAANADGSSVSTATGACSRPGAMFDYMTGAACTTTTTVAGCPAGAMFNSMTGAACTTTTVTTPVVTSGVEGTLDQKLAATPSNEANIQTSTDVPVYGIELRGKIADMVVQTLDLQVSVTPTTGGSENPSTLINTIKVWDGSSVVATIPVNSTTFTKDSNQDYYARISGLNFVLPANSVKTLVVSFSTNSIDTDRTVVIDGYRTNSLRAVSGNGVSSFYSLDALTRTHTFKKPGSSTLTLSAASSPLRSQNYRINPTNGVENVPLLTFNVKSETGASKLQSLVVNVATTTSALQTVELWDGSTKIGSENAAGTVTFNNLESIVVGQDVTKTLTLKGNWSSSAADGSSASTSVASVTFEKPNGTSASVSTPVYGVYHYVYKTAAQWTLAGTPTISKTTNQNGSTTEMTATFTFNVTALGGTIKQPVAADFTIVAATSTANPIATAVGAPVVIPNNNVSDGSTAQVSVTATLGTGSVVHSGQYGFVISQINWGTTTGSQVSQTWGLDDIKTPSTSYFAK
ncbi:MAG: peptidoglycan-binding protein [Candidatus Pacebacteria bacterium]|nr:peptidoglycan-binding protein [Candidatus Paceibacterota bacterium]